MSTPAPQQFKKPALEILVDQINLVHQPTLDYGDVEIMSVVAVEEIEADYETIPQLLLHPTIAVIKANAVEKQINYRRLGLATYLYQHLVNAEALTGPGYLVDRFATTEATAVADALAYLNSTYEIELNPDDCEILSRPDLRSVDGTWPVSVALRLDHPVWVGSVCLNAFDSVD